jgi:hypothetical protein
VNSLAQNLSQLWTPSKPATTSLADYIRSWNPIRYYTFGETSGTNVENDLGNGFDGAYAGGFTLGNEPSPLQNDPLPFASVDGIDGRIELPEQVFTGDFTLNFWFRLDVESTANVIIGADNYNATPRNVLAVKPFFFGDQTLIEATTTDGTGNATVVADVWPVSAWVFVSVVRSTTTVTLYRDAAPIVSQVVGSGSMTLPNIRLGCIFQVGANTGFLAGSYKHLMMFDFAMSQAQQQEFIDAAA